MYKFKPIRKQRYGWRPLAGDESPTDCSPDYPYDSDEDGFYPPVQSPNSPNTFDFTSTAQFELQPSFSLVPDDPFFPNSPLQNHSEAHCLPLPEPQARPHITFAEEITVLYFDKEEAVCELSGREKWLEKEENDEKEQQQNQVGNYEAEEKRQSS